MKERLAKIWRWFKTAIKNPITLISFLCMWVLLESPAIFGIIAFGLTKNPKWWALVGSWVALTAPPLPIPVVPISIAFAVTMQELQKKVKKHRLGRPDKTSERAKAKHKVGGKCNKDKNDTKMKD